MIAETQAAIAKTAGSVASTGSAVKAFTLANPIALAVTGGIILGAVAYYAADKYWLNKDEEDETETAEA
jgi:hypothetical protein